MIMTKTVFHYTEEQLRRYIIDVYEKNASGEWKLIPYKQINTNNARLYDVVNGKVGYWTDYKRKKFVELNMDFNSPTCHACYKVNRTFQNDKYIVSNEKILEFTLNGNYYYIQKQTYSKRIKGHSNFCYAIHDSMGDFAVNDFSYTKRGIMARFNKMYKEHAVILTA